MTAGKAVASEAMMRREEAERGRINKWQRGKQGTIRRGTLAPFNGRQMLDLNELLAERGRAAVTGGGVVVVVVV